MDSVEVCVVGAGVVGLAIARRLAVEGFEVIVLEGADTIGTGISSRNSEVIHAGIYYPEGSLKAQLCVEGKHRLYEWCAARAVPHRRCGKLIVATSADQIQTLEDLKRRAAANGVDDLVLIDGEEARRREPALRCVAALWSPSSGIVDSHALMLSLLGDAEDHGAVLALETPVIGGAREGGGLVVETGGAHPHRLNCLWLVNAAGLASPHVARLMHGYPEGRTPDYRLAKGSYFSLSGRSPFSRLIYPVPERGGLGVHVTIDLGGQCRFGPDVEWVEREDYDVDPSRSERFYEAVRRYWPGLGDGALAPAYAGIRPKRVGPGEPDADFLIEGQSDHGVVGLINVLGIESPGLTASLALAERVSDLIRGAQ
jgi:L-2-hydroxyglutarate oxidase LhgO